MYLTLEVVSANAASLGPGRRKVFTVDGGRIGRSPDSDMVLKSPGVHRHHATVRFINGVFFVEGVGTNGIAVNNAERILPRNEPYPLKTGDKLYIDEYELAVTVSATAPEADPPPAAVHSGLPPLTELTGPPPSTFAPLAESLGEPFSAGLFRTHVHQWREDAKPRRGAASIRREVGRLGEPT